MSETTSAELLTTPLYDLHLELGAKMVPFAGYHMPVQYRLGVLQEHLHTRRAAGLFDVSHMGQVKVTGPNAAAALESVIPVDIAGLAPHQQRYGFLTNEQGGLLDDLMVVNRTGAEGPEWLLVINGACKAADLAHLASTIGAKCELTHLTDQSLLALQGPLAGAALQNLCDAPVLLRFMQGGWFDLEGIKTYITRSGYTGEDGFEISVPAKDAKPLARLLLAQPDVQAIGLGARNSLRLEAGLCLYGNDLSPTTNPINAQLQWAIQKVRRAGGARAGGFIGWQAVHEAQSTLGALQSGSAANAATTFKVRVGLLGLERVPVREPALLLDAEGQEVGQVCSGLLSPMLDQPIAMAYVPYAWAQPGQTLFAKVRDRLVPMQVCPLPFVPHRYLR